MNIVEIIRSRIDEVRSEEVILDRISFRGHIIIEELERLLKIIENGNNY